MKQAPTRATASRRDALLQSERAANRTEPENFNERALTEKIVEIPPPGTSDAPIKGLDPAPPKR